MDAQQIVTWLGGLHPAIPIVLGSLGLLMVLGQGVVILTATKKDDEFVDKMFAIPLLGDILKLLAKMAPFKYPEKKE